MNLAVILMIVIIAISLIVIAIASIGTSVGRARRSGIGVVMANTAKHLNGDADPPAGLVNLVQSIPLPRSAASASEPKNR